ncbi:hypothetical protein DFP72DRAFT_811540 [Ephemerocybe angulata]|uniref:DUF3295 domain-containing protein n=1 Tax=Ephemerocybe angulata TaxID=980116 RepID=A0A8H6M7X0_9AGAR|nr:hypothetical protein DFP72DRAFT_811540 [Tulosesus angulatus]
MASSVKPKGVVAPPSIAPDLRSGGSAGSSGYRPKGPLPGQEMEESDSEEEGTNNSVQLSQSVAQDRLRQFAARRGITKPNGALPTQPEAGAQAQLYPEGAEVERTVSGPIPMRHPYNLPVNALPSTPRTTRRQMLKSEMSESLRRQLLWERRQAGVPIRRTTSTGGVAANPKINALNPLRPLTTTPSMVQLRAKGRASTGLQDAHAAEVEDDRKRTAMARNRSWAHDYHTSGW